MSKTRWLIVPWSAAMQVLNVGAGGYCLHKAVDTLQFVQKEGETVKGLVALWREQ